MDQHLFDVDVQSGMLQQFRSLLVGKSDLVRDDVPKIHPSRAGLLLEVRCSKLAFEAPRHPWGLGMPTANYVNPPDSPLTLITASLHFMQRTTLTSLSNDLETPGRLIVSLWSGKQHLQTRRLRLPSCLPSVPRIARDPLAWICRTRG